MILFSLIVLFFYLSSFSFSQDWKGLFLRLEGLFLLSHLIEMPLFHRHRRHYSWPYCGPSPHGRERLDLTDTRGSKLRSSAKEQFLPFKGQNTGPLFTEDIFDEDDAISAGIVRPKSTRHHRLWSLSKDRDEVVSSVTEADELPGAVLRRMVWAQLEKGRLPFTLHTTTATGENVTISYLDTMTAPEKSAHGPDATKGSLGDEYLRPLPGRHRRCHSEQPRAWREPSACLWTLEEE